MQIWRLMLIIGCLQIPTLAAETQIYKTVNADGSISFSDQTNSSDSAEVISIQKTNQIQVVKPSALKKYKQTLSANPKEKKNGPTSYSISIDSPKAETTFRNESANAISITSTTKPALFPGHKLQVFHNGQLLEGTQISNLQRGAHTVKVEIVNSEGKTISSSDRSTFYVQRQSIN